MKVPIIQLFHTHQKRNHYQYSNLPSFCVLQKRERESVCVLIYLTPIKSIFLSLPLFQIPYMFLMQHFTNTSHIAPRNRICVHSSHDQSMIRNITIRDIPRSEIIRDSNSQIRQFVCSTIIISIRGCRGCWGGRFWSLRWSARWIWRGWGG